MKILFSFVFAAGPPTTAPRSQCGSSSLQDDGSRPESFGEPRRRREMFRLHLQPWVLQVCIQSPSQLLPLLSLFLRKWLCWSRFEPVGTVLLSPCRQSSQTHPTSFLTPPGPLPLACPARVNHNRHCASVGSQSARCWPWKALTSSFQETYTGRPEENLLLTTSPTHHGLREDGYRSQDSLRIRHQARELRSANLS